MVIIYSLNYYQYIIYTIFNEASWWAANNRISVGGTGAKKSP